MQFVVANIHGCQRIGSGGWMLQASVLENTDDVIIHSEENSERCIVGCPFILGAARPNGPS